MCTWSEWVSFMQNMQLKHYRNALKLFEVYNTTQDSYSLWSYCVFTRKFAAAIKNLKTNYTFFVKETCFLLIQEIRKSMTNFWLWQSWLWQILDKYWYSINFFHSRTYSRGVFRTQSNIYNKAFLWFSQRCSIVYVLLGFKNTPLRAFTYRSVP